MLNVQLLCNSKYGKVLMNPALGMLHICNIIKVQRLTYPANMHSVQRPSYRYCLELSTTKHTFRSGSSTPLSFQVCTPTLVQLLPNKRLTEQQLDIFLRPVSCR